MNFLTRVLEKASQLLCQLGLQPLPGNDSKHHAAVYTDSQIDSFLCGADSNYTLDTRETVPGRLRGSEVVVGAIKDRAPLRLDAAFSGARINYWRPFKSILIEKVYIAAGDMVFSVSLLGQPHTSIVHIDGGNVVITTTLGVADWNRLRKTILESFISVSGLPGACSAQVKLRIHCTINREAGAISITSEHVVYLGIKLEPLFNYIDDKDALVAMDAAFKNTRVLGYTVSA